MKFKKVLEAVELDKSDHYSGPAKLLYSPEGTLKHTKEIIESHIINFSVQKNNKGKLKLIPTYIYRKSVHTPMKKGKAVDELPILKKKDSNIEYQQSFEAPIKKEFSTFLDFYEFTKNEYENNPWPYKLIKRIIDDGMNMWREKNKDSQKSLNYFDTIASMPLKLANIIKYMLRIEKKSDVQYYVVIQKRKYGKDKILYGDGLKSNINLVIREIDREMKQLSA